MSSIPDPRTKALHRACQAVITTINESGKVGSLAELQLALSGFDTPNQTDENYQSRVMDWIRECFGPIESSMRVERNHRFLEEALELVQSLGCSEEEAGQLLNHVYSRPIGEPIQELGGVMVTLAALSGVNQMSMVEGGEEELKRVWKKIDQIKDNQKEKKSITSKKK